MTNRKLYLPLLLAMGMLSACGGSGSGTDVVANAGSDMNSGSYSGSNSGVDLTVRNSENGGKANADTEEFSIQIGPNIY